MSKQERLVSYVSPFGSPAWMPRDRATELMEQDDERWVRFTKAEALTGCRILSEAERQVGPPEDRGPQWLRSPCSTTRTTPSTVVGTSTW